MKVLIVFDHPYGIGASENVPHDRSYTAALTAAAIRGLERAGHKVDLIDLAADGFSPVMTREDLAAWRLKTVVDPLAADYQRRLMEADHLILAFPVWWESMPAGTKGFLDKVLTKGVVYKEPVKAGRFINGIPNIQGVSLLTVMSTPKFLYRWLLGNPLPKILLRGTFRKIGVKNLHWISAHDPAGTSLEARQKYITKVEERFARLTPTEAPATAQRTQAVSPR
jgi:NAD(P)H dehydrogenase (quinone)